MSDRELTAERLAELDALVRGAKERRHSWVALDPDTVQSLVRMARGYLQSRVGSPEHLHKWCPTREAK